MLINPRSKEKSYDYDIDAFKKHPWKQIFIICETTGTCGSEGLLEWLDPLDKDNPTNKPSYHLQFELTKVLSCFLGSTVFTCLVLSKEKPTVDSVVIKLTERS